MFRYIFCDLNVEFFTDSMQEMPYFSHSELVTRYGYSEHLRYIYYLKQARPSFAFITFLTEEFRHGGSNLPAKR